MIATKKEDIPIVFGSKFASPSILGEIRDVRREIVGAGLKPAGRKVGRPGFRAEIVDSGRFQTDSYKVLGTRRFLCRTVLRTF